MTIIAKMPHHFCFLVHKHTPSCWQSSLSEWLLADEYLQAADCLQSVAEFSQGQQVSAFPDFAQQCLRQKASLQEVWLTSAHAPVMCQTFCVRLCACTDTQTQVLGGIVYAACFFAPNAYTTSAALRHLCTLPIVSVCCTEDSHADSLCWAPSSEQAAAAGPARLCGCCHSMAGTCCTRM